MSQKIRAILALLVLSAGAAQAQAPMNCTGLDPNSAPDSIRAFDCIGGLDSDIKIAMEMIETLRNEIELLQSQLGNTAPIPSGTVAAFDIRDGCPAGWSPFVQSQGRVIVGASFGEDDQLLTPPPPQRKYGDHGGTASIVIEEKHLPAHRHGMVVVNSPSGIDHPDNEGSQIPYFDLRNREQLPRGLDGEPLRAKVSNQGEGTLAAGGAEPLGFFPPYIALYFCKKNAT